MPAARRPVLIVEVRDCRHLPVDLFVDLLGSSCRIIRSYPSRAVAECKSLRDLLEIHAHEIQLAIEILMMAIDGLHLVGLERRLCLRDARVVLGKVERCIHGMR